MFRLFSICWAFRLDQFLAKTGVLLPQGICGGGASRISGGVDGVSLKASSVLHRPNRVVHEVLRVECSVGDFEVGIGVRCIELDDGRANPKEEQGIL